MKLWMEYRLRSKTQWGGKHTDWLADIRCFITDAICSHSMNLNIRSELSLTLASHPVWEPEPLWKQLEQLVPPSVDKLRFWRPGSWFNQQFICQQQPSPLSRRTTEIFATARPLLPTLWSGITSTQCAHQDFTMGTKTFLSSFSVILTRCRVERGREESLSTLWLPRARR